VARKDEIMEIKQPNKEDKKKTIIKKEKFIGQTFRPKSKILISKTGIPLR